MKKINLFSTDNEKFYDLEFNVDTKKHTVSTAGSFFKTYSNGVYYKLSSYDSFKKQFGNESVYEVIAFRIGKLLNFPVLEYNIEHGYITVENDKVLSTFCSCRDFNKNNYDTLTIEQLCVLHNCPESNCIELMSDLGFKHYIDQIMLFDYIICNRDRHGANIEFLILSDDTLVPTPIFDNGVSFMFSAHTDSEFLKYDVSKNPAVNNFIGSRDLEYNLGLITTITSIPILTMNDIDNIFVDLDKYLSETHIEKLKDMIYWRYNHVREMLHLQ